jgi:5-methylcytosine-specific restriction endonuclease McrA
MDSLPSESEVAAALLTLLKDSTPPRITPRQAYQRLAEQFELSEIALGLEMASEESAWENRVRYARWDLIKAGQLDGSQRGIWKLVTDEPDDEADDELDINEEATGDDEELQQRSNNLLRRGKVNRPVGYLKARTTTSEGTTYLRDPRVRAWVLQTARGRCELCEKPGPFVLGTGESYLEVHHVVFLSLGGSDTVENAVGVCPNCHRHLHLGTDADDQREALYKKVERLARS